MILYSSRLISIPPTFNVSESFSVSFNRLKRAFTLLTNNCPIEYSPQITKFPYLRVTDFDNQSICIDKINKKGVVMTYNVNGYTTFDYSGLMNGGSTFVKDPRPTHSNPQIYIGSQNTGGGYVESTGLYYVGGLCAAGEWAYASDYDARHYKRCMRRNMKTGVETKVPQAEAAQFLKISKPTLDKLVAKEVVPFMILGDQKRFIKSDLLNIGRSDAL